MKRKIDYFITIVFVGMGLYYLLSPQAEPIDAKWISGMIYLLLATNLSLWMKIEDLEKRIKK